MHKNKGIFANLLYKLCQPFKEMKNNAMQDLAFFLNQPITTRRLVLEPLVGAHADLLFEPLCDMRIYRWINAGIAADIAELRTIWQRNESRISPNGDEIWLNWAIRLRNDGPYIGKLDAELDSPSMVTNIGFILFPEYWGGGFATESLQATITDLSNKGILFMRASVAKPNIASARVLEKAGFTRVSAAADRQDTCEYSLVIPKRLIYKDS